MFKEEFLHYIWKFKLFTSKGLYTVDGEEIKIIHQGQHNSDGGPDFFNSKIKIAETTWAGNVEIHLKSSDWIKHRHQNDKAYQNVILHVVYEHDKKITDQLGRAISTLELKGLINESLVEKYEDLIFSKGWIPCASQLKLVDHFTINNWKERLILERLERKSEEVMSTLKLNKNNWEETFYQYLFKYFGLKINALPFEILAKNTPLKIISKHNKIGEIEALLFGQAGFLQDHLKDDYTLQLKKEYLFLRSKFALQPMDKSCWKLLRLRPNNFPTIRISQLSNLLSKDARLFSKILTSETIDDLKKIITTKASAYWENHYQFDVLSLKKSEKKVGDLLKNNIIINVVIPFVFVYAKVKQDESLNQKTLGWLLEIKAENNSIIKKWNFFGINTKNARDSQALIELKNNYCSQKKCLNCSIGNNLLKQ